jgi:hypothetical protein
MEKRLNNKLTMYRAAYAVLQKYSGIWQPVPVMVTLSDELKTAIESIETLSKQASESTVGVTESKNQLWEKLIKESYIITSALTAYAARTGNAELKNKVNYTESDLVNSRQNQLLDDVEKIYALAAENISKLADYGIVAAELESIRVNIDSFRQSMPGSRSTIANRKVSGQSLRELFAQTDNILNEQLDRMMEKYTKVNPAFYEEYKVARTIVDYGLRHEKVTETPAAQQA